MNESSAVKMMKTYSRNELILHGNSQNKVNIIVVAIEMREQRQEGLRRLDSCGKIESIFASLCVQVQASRYKPLKSRGRSYT